MCFRNVCRRAWGYAGLAAALFGTMLNLVSQPRLAAQATASGAFSKSPIQHVIIIIGENRTFDHVFATYKPKYGQAISNLLSREIINADGTPGINYFLSAQYSAVHHGTFSISPSDKSVYRHIPPVGTGGAPTAPSDTSPAPFKTLSLARLVEPDLFHTYNRYLLTGATGLAHDIVDQRIPNVNGLGQGVFQLTPSVKYDDYAASPVHRFYQMWQQVDCNADYSTPSNPSGCLSDLFPWVEVSVEAGSNGKPQPAGFNDLTTGEGSTAMEFYNVQQGDAPYLKDLADNYTLADNYHQAVMGGTGANHIMLGYGDDLWYSDGKGVAMTPPANQIENPDPQPGTNNYYAQDGYSGGSYSDCSDPKQPGVTSVITYLAALPTPINANCEPGHYYLLNNYNPGYVGDGTLDSQYTQFAIPPSSVRHIGDALTEAKVSFTYFGEGWNLYVTDPAGVNPYDAYCNICNFFQYATDIMTDPSAREAHIQDTTSLYEDIDTGSLQAVSWVKPSGFVDGHPASSKLDLFEGFVKKIVTQVQQHPDLWKTTAIFVTFDEGGGYYDSGYIQPLDFFGDGTRIPLLVVSPYATGGRIYHGYSDHVSLLKFIERNWGLAPLTSRSRDNFPNPVTASDDPYVPLNSPAIADLFDAFSFGSSSSAKP